MQINREYVLNLMQDVLNARYNADSKEDIDLEFEDMDSWQVTDLIQIRDTIDNIRGDAFTLRQFVNNRIKSALENKAYRHGDRVFRGRSSTKLVPYDIDKVIEYLGDDWQQAVRPAFRTSAIKHIAEQRGDKPNIVMESLFERVETDDVQVLPYEKSAKFIQKALDSDGKEIELNFDKEQED